MGTDSAARRRIAIRHGDSAEDVAIDPDLPIGMSLQDFNVNAQNPAIIAVDSTGRKIDMSVPPRNSFVDGSTITFVDLNQLQACALEGAPALSPRWRSTRPRIAWSLALISSGLLIMTVMLVLVDGDFGSAASTSMRWTVPQWARFVMGTLLLLMSLAAAIVDGARETDKADEIHLHTLHSAGLRLGSLVIAPLLAFVAAILMVPLVTAARGHLMVFSGLLMAAVVATLSYVVRRTGYSGQAAGMLAVMMAIAACLFGVTLALGWPGTVAGATLIGLVPPILKALPTWCVRVPDNQLVNVNDNMVMRWTVRGTLPSKPERVETERVADLVLRAELTRDLGTVVLAVIPPLLLPWILTSTPFGSVSWWGAVVLAFCVVVALFYLPRSVRGSISRWGPRIGAIAVLCELSVGVAWLYDLVALTVAVFALVLAILIGILVAPIGRGYRALGPSRAADAGEWLVVILALPSALIAADLIELLRVMTSG